MADFSNFVTVGSVQNKSSASSLTFTVGATGAAPGSAVLALVALDNLQTGDVEDGTDIAGFSDSKGNTWSRAKTFTNGNAGAGTGVTVGLYFCKVATDLLTGDTITATFSANVTAKCMTLGRVTLDTGKDMLVAGTAVLANDLADPGPISLSGLPSREYLFVYAVAKEGNLASITHEPGYSTFTSNGTGGAAAVSNVAIAGAALILTDTGDTVDTTWGSQDHAQAYAAFYLEAAAPPSDPSSIPVYELVASPVKRFDLDGSQDLRTLEGDPVKRFPLGLEE